MIGELTALLQIPFEGPLRGGREGKAGGKERKGNAREKTSPSLN